MTPGLTLYSQAVVLPTQDLQEGLIPSHCVGENIVSLVLKRHDGEMGSTFDLRLRQGMHAAFVCLPL